jgi:hypothetical protein
MFGLHCATAISANEVSANVIQNGGRQIRQIDESARFTDLFGLMFPSV